MFGLDQECDGCCCLLAGWSTGGGYQEPGARKVRAHSMAATGRKLARSPARNAADCAGGLFGSGVEIEGCQCVICVLADRCRNESLHDDHPHQAGDCLSAALCAAFAHESGSGFRVECHSSKAVVDMAQAISSLGSQPQSAVVSGELDRAGTA